MPVRWLYHAKLKEDPLTDPYAPPGLHKEGFIHASFVPAIAESVRLYFPEPEQVEILQIDPRALDTPVTLAETPRGPMPHIMGPIPAAAVVHRWTIDDVHEAPDARIEPPGG